MTVRMVDNEFSLEERVERLEREVGIPEIEFEQTVRTVAKRLDVDIQQMESSNPGRVARLDIPDEIDARMREFVEVQSELSWAAYPSDGFIEVW